MTSLRKILHDKLVHAAQHVQGLTALIDALLHSSEIDDRLLLQEKLLALMSRLGNSTAKDKDKDKAIFDDLQAFVIDLLHKDLPHPPSAYLSALVQPNSSSSSPSTPNEGGYINYAYRAADGSNYNPLIPRFGAAGQPYARTVPSTTLLTPTLPDPGLIFDTLFRRPKHADRSSIFEPHPQGQYTRSQELVTGLIHQRTQKYRASKVQASRDLIRSLRDFAGMFS